MRLLSKEEPGAIISCRCRADKGDSTVIREGAWGSRVWEG